MKNVAVIATPGVFGRLGNLSMFFRNSQPLQYFLVLWILKGETSLNGIPNKNVTHFRTPRRVFARFENPIFFELASIYVLLVLTYFSNVWVVVESGLQDFPN